MVAVQRPLLRIEGTPDERVLGQLPLHLPHLATRRAEERQRGAGPDQDSHVDPLCELGEQVAEHRRRPVAFECKAWREVPAGEVHMRAGAAQRVGDPRQRSLAVDQDLERVAVADRRSFRPAPCGRIERPLPPDSAQAASVVRTDLPGQLVAGPA